MRRDMAALGAVVVFVTVVAPLGRLIGTLYVLIRVHERTPPRHLRRVFAIAERLRPWSMIEVFVFGVFVAYVKLGDLVTIGLMTGVYALLALTFVLVWMDSALDREAVWERLDRRNLAAWLARPRRVPSAARPVVWSASPSPTTHAVRAAKARCTSASRTASRAPGPWSSPPRSFTFRRTTTRC